MKTISNLKIPFLLLCLGLSGPALQAQFQISGTVVFGKNQEPVPTYEVNILLPVHDQLYTVLTDDEGYYEAGFDWTSGEMLEAVVQVIDICTGELKSVRLPNADSLYVADFYLCQGVDPPPPPPGCQAHFTYEQLAVNPPTVLFFDLSYHSEPEVSYSWNFGDGTTSEEAAPTHEFPAVGAYEVSLTVGTPACISHFEQTVIVRQTLDCVCNAVYNPVCVTLDDGTMITFSNDCEARCAGFSEGDWMSCEPNECGCPEFYDPVCTVSPSGDSLTFSNVCFAECAGYGPDQVYKCNPINDCECAPVDKPVCVVNDAGEILRFPNACLAQCAGYPSSSIVDCNISCICPNDYDPVCVVVAGDTLSFSNSCFAECEGYAPDQLFSCDPTEDCTCPRIYDPVCVITVEGDSLSFNNACLAECAGYTSEQIFICYPDTCVCIEIYDPVCVVENGVTRTFDNDCFARCAGYTDDQIFKCEPGECNCPEIYSPVCILTDFGPAYWFINACEAECAGFGPDEYESCGPDDCVCPAVYDPVCAISVSGDTLRFGNSCEAICAGFGENQLFDCVIANPCNCDTIYDPVCVYTPGGTVLRFANACEARCAGYEETVWVNCEETYCQAKFLREHPDAGELGVQFVNRSQPMDVSDIEWFWDFGDSTTSQEADPFHQYAKAGVYAVNLVMTTPAGCYSRYHEKVVVGLDGPLDTDCKAMFFFDQDPADPYFFQFHDMSLGNVVAWNWYFGDGTTSNEPAPQHTYSQAGIYIVSLSITTMEGCTNLVSMLVATDDDIVYNPECHAVFLPIIIPDSSQVYFLNFSSQDVVETHWDFGDGATSDQLMPIHHYNDSGSYTVTLTVVTENGCTNSYSATINISGANFTATPSYEFRTTTNTDEPARIRLSIKLFPNPVTTELWLDLQDHSGGEIQWRLLNLSGQLVQHGQRDLAGGHQQFSIQTTDLVPGLYVIQLRSADGMITKKFVKQE